MKALKFGTAIVAVLVGLLSMAAVASAATNGFAEGEYSASLQGTTSGPSIFIERGIGECEGGTLSDEKAGPATSLAGSLSGLKCKEFGITTPISMNSCKFIFRPGAETSAGVFAATAEIGPANCGSITYNPGCETKWPAQTGLGATLTNLSGGKVEVALKAEHMKYTECGGPTRENGTWKQTWVVSATHSGASVSTKVEDLAIGLSLVEKIEKQPKFAGTRYPMTVTGSQTAAYNLVFNGNPGSAKCKTATFRSPGIGGEAGWLPLAPTFSSGGCEVWGFLNRSIYPNSCEVTVKPTSVTSGTASISCPTTKMEISGIGCAVTIGQQENLGTVSFTNLGAGNEAYVAATLALSGITYTETGMECPHSGQTNNNGTLNGTINLRGYELGFLG